MTNGGRVRVVLKQSARVSLVVCFSLFVLRRRRLLLDNNYGRYARDTCLNILRAYSTLGQYSWLPDVFRLKGSVRVHTRYVSAHSPHLLEDHLYDHWASLHCHASGLGGSLRVVQRNRHYIDKLSRPSLLGCGT